MVLFEIIQYICFYRHKKSLDRNKSGKAKDPSFLIFLLFVSETLRRATCVEEGSTPSGVLRPSFHSYNKSENKLNTNNTILLIKHLLNINSKYINVLNVIKILTQ